MVSILVLTIIAVFVTALSTILTMVGLAFTFVNKIMVRLLQCCPWQWFAPSARCRCDHSILIVIICNHHRMVELSTSTSMIIIPGIRMIIRSGFSKVIVRLSILIVVGLSFTMMSLMLLRCPWRWFTSSAPCRCNHSILSRRIRRHQQLMALTATSMMIMPSIRMLIIRSGFRKVLVQLSSIVDMLRITHITHIRRRILMIRILTIHLLVHVLMVPLMLSMRATVLLLTRRS